MTNKAMLNNKSAANASLQDSSVYATRKMLFLNAYQYFINRGMGNDAQIENLAQQ